MAHKKNIRINDADDLELKILTTDIDICPYRCRLAWHFGHVISIECPHRKTLKKRYAEHLARIENQKYREEYPDG